MIYKRIEGKTGVKYFADRRFISKDKIPIAVLERLGTKPEVKFNYCIFCKNEGTHQRIVDKLMVYSCDEHYFNTTYGQQVAQLRKERDAKTPSE